MAIFRMKIADCVAQVNSLFDSTPEYFRSYLTEDGADFSITVTQAHLDFEQADSEEEALREGFRLRRFTDPFLERAAIQRQFAEFLLEKDTLLCHGSAISVDGNGYLFLAKSGTGKSTHTALWQQLLGSRSVMVNDDKPFLHITSQGVWVCGSPWSGKHGRDTNIRVPLTGICLLQRGRENRISPMEKALLLPILRHQSYQPQDCEKQEICNALLDSLVEQVPLWRMECTKDPQAAQVAYDAMGKQ